MYCGDRGGAYEADGHDFWVGQEGVDRGFVAVDYVEDAWGAAGFEEEFGQADGDGGVTFGGFQDEGVAAGDGGAGFPEGDHGGEVEGGYTGYYA